MTDVPLLGGGKITPLPPVTPSNTLTPFPQGAGSGMDTGTASSGGSGLGSNSYVPYNPSTNAQFDYASHQKWHFEFWYKVAKSGVAVAVEGMGGRRPSDNAVQSTLERNPAFQQVVGELFASTNAVFQKPVWTDISASLSPFLGLKAAYENTAFQTDAVVSLLTATNFSTFSDMTFQLNNLLYRQTGTVFGYQTVPVSPQDRNMKPPNGYVSTDGDDIVFFGYQTQNEYGGTGRDVMLFGEANSSAQDSPGSDIYIFSGSQNTLRYNAGSSNFVIDKDVEGNAYIRNRVDGSIDRAVNLTTIEFRDKSVSLGPASSTGRPTTMDNVDASPPVLSSYAFFGLQRPDASQVRALEAFVAAQYQGYKADGVLRPEIGPFEAMGLALSGMGDFKTQFGAMSTNSFVQSAYTEIFGRAPTATQVTHFTGQVQYFYNLYTGIGLSASESALQARGAAAGQMLGFAVLDEPSSPFGSAYAYGFM